MQIDTTPAAIVARLEAHRGNARVRNLDLDDVVAIVETHEKALAWAEANGLDPEIVETHAVGGVVPNSYKYPPAADEVRIRGRRVVSAARGYAKRRAGGGHGVEIVTSIRVEAGTPAAEVAKADDLAYHGGYVRCVR
jgi:hypothetical protein